MIDNADPRQRKPDDVLADLVSALRQMEEGLMKLIQDANDEYVTNEALLINDNLQQTLFRFQQLKNHQKPKPFRSSFEENKDEDFGAGGAAAPAAYAAPAQPSALTLRK